MGADYKVPQTLWFRVGFDVGVYNTQCCTLPRQKNICLWFMTDDTVGGMIRMLWQRARNTLL